MDVPRQLVRLNKALVLERLGGDEQLLGEIAGLFLSDYPGMLEQVRQAVARQDSSALHHAAHTLKGAIANFCADAPFESAYRLERMGREEDLAGAEEALSELERHLLSLEPILADLQNESASRP
ncbi:MAG: Hpt domain-containing protein [Acidobacteriales bacterium]|nr:Hpt domain-containing protein [Terriglobales bacterium]